MMSPVSSRNITYTVLWRYMHLAFSHDTAPSYNLTGVIYNVVFCAVHITMSFHMQYNTTMFAIIACHIIPIMSQHSFTQPAVCIVHGLGLRVRGFRG